MSNYLYYDATAANYAATVDAAALSPAGDIDIRVRVAEDTWDWSGAAETFIAKDVDYGLSTTWSTVEGELAFQWKDTSTHQVFSGAQPPITDGVAGWVRATLDVNGGAAGVGRVQFYYSTDATNDPDAVSWTALGSAQDGGDAPTFTFDGAAALRVGGHGTTGDWLAGKVYRATVYDGIGGTIVFDADFTDLTAAELAAGEFVEDSTNAATVTLNGDSWAYVRPVTTGLLATAELVLQAHDGNEGGSPKWADPVSYTHLTLPTTPYV